MFTVGTITWAATAFAFLGIPEETCFAFYWQTVTIAKIRIPVGANWTKLRLASTSTFCWVFFINDEIFSSRAHYWFAKTLAVFLAPEET